MIVPIFLVFALGGLASMCTAITGAKAAKRRLQQQREVARTATAPAMPARLGKDSASAPAAAGAQITACPERLPDMAGWKRMSADGSPIEIPVPPDFEMVPQTGSVEVNPPFLVLRATNGDEYRLTHTTRSIRASDVRDYESTSTCRIYIGNVIADLETARDTWRGGEHRAVFASYWLGTMNYITIQGTTETAEHHQQLVAAIHGAQFRK